VGDVQENWPEDILGKRKDLIAQMHYTMGAFSSPVLERMMLQGMLCLCLDVDV
jgi:hypothetical protein